MTDPAGTHEAARQQALLVAVRARSANAADAGLAEADERARAGLQIYRSNAWALAERALAAAFPTVQALLGEADFKRMARAHWHDAPAERGDIGVWGGGLPRWLAAQPALAQWPYLADCAQLDWLRHVCERAADAEFDAPSLAMLASTDPDTLILVLKPGVAVLASAWPVASIFEAHQGAPPNFEAARDAIEQRRGEAVLVARCGWLAQVHRIDLPTLDWTNHLLAGNRLSQALNRAGPAFDLSAWLARALRDEWLHGVRDANDA